MLNVWNQAVWERFRAIPLGAGGAVLLAGPRGVGKRSFARTLAKALLCPRARGEAEGCGDCASCRLFEAGSHPDFRRMEPSAEDAGADASAAQAGSAGSGGARVITVGQVRELAQFLDLTSHFGGAKVVLIQPADRMHASAANALLKTLEEPTAGTLFLLVADHPNSLPVTVRSRCLRIDFQVPSREVALRWLVEKGVREPEIALAQAGFAPLAAERMAQGEFWERRRTLTDALSSVDVDPERLTAQVDAADLAQFWGLLCRWCYDLMSLRLAGQVRYNPDYAEKLSRLADNADVLALNNMLKELIAAGRALDHPLNPRLVVEQLAIQYTRAIAAQPSS